MRVSVSDFAHSRFQKDRAECEEESSFCLSTGLTTAADNRASKRTVQVFDTAADRVESVKGSAVVDQLAALVLEHLPDGPLGDAGAPWRGQYIWRTAKR